MKIDGCLCRYDAYSGISTRDGCPIHGRNIINLKMYCHNCNEKDAGACYASRLQDAAVGLDRCGCKCHKGTEATYRCLRCGINVEGFAHVLCNRCVADQRILGIEPLSPPDSTDDQDEITRLQIANAELEKGNRRREKDRAGLVEQLTIARDELRERNEELRVVWHAMACPFDHCERCIEDADVIKRIRFRLGPAT